MTVDITQSPTLAIPGKPIRIAFTLGTGDYVRVYLTDAPQASKYYAGLDKSAANRILMHSGDANVDWLFTADVAGRYVFVMQDVSRGASAYGGRYEGDPDGYSSLTVNDETAALDISVGARMQLPIQVDEHGATLRFYVWDEDVRATNVTTHGETTPALVDPTTERADQAMLDDDVVAAVAALTGTSDDIDDILTDPYSAAEVLDHMIFRFNTHCASTTFHYSVDSNNQLSDDYSDATDSDALAEIVAALQAAFRRHLTNDMYDLSTPSVGVGTGDFHQDGSSNNVGDWTNQPLAPQPTDIATAMVALADLWRCYAAHRQWTAGHKAEDTSFVITLPLLLQVPRYFCAVIAANDPSVPDTAHPGVARLAAEAGMTES